MILAIVGSEAKKFTPVSERRARTRIRKLFTEYRPTLVISGQCHLGGIDIWAIEEASKLGIAFREYPPEKLSWQYYKRRNIQMATKADVTVCLTVDRLPRTYRGMRFGLCYHCLTKDHVKSGGCWTVRYARSLGKPGRVITIKQGTAR